MKVLSKEKMQNYSVIKVLMKLRSYVILNKLNDVIKANSIELQQVVEKLMYIVCETQSNIVFMVGCLS